jgi:selenocysteine lyase/cysteine desulfurase
VDASLQPDESGANRNVVVTKLDHDANVSPWLSVAERTGAEVRWVPLRHDGHSLDQDAFAACLDANTALVALGYASNGIGTINPVKQMIRLVTSTSAQCLIEPCNNLAKLNV